MIKTVEDTVMSADEMMNQTIGEFLSKIGDDELERLHHTLQLHLASSDGENDGKVQLLFEAVEFEQIHRD
jgi:hypothetical protein